MMHLRRNIELIRLLTKLSQHDFGRVLGEYSKAQIASYESGKANPNLLFKLKLQELSGVEVEKLEKVEIDIKDVKINKEMIDLEIKSGVQDGVSSGHPVGKLNLAGLKISEADRELLGVLSSLIEDGFSSQSSKLDKMKDDILSEIRKGNAFSKSKGNKG